MLVRFLYGFLVFVFLAAASTMYRYSRPTPALAVPDFVAKDGCRYAGIGDIEIKDLTGMAATITGH